MKTPRCPSCGNPAVRVSGLPVLPGMLVVCAGCLVPSRFDAAGERLVTMDPGDILEDMREQLVELQRQLRSRFGPLGRPRGYRWRTMALCRSCWEDFENRAPGTVARGVPTSPCAFCGELTDAGIYRRLLVKEAS